MSDHENDYSSDEDDSSVENEKTMLTKQLNSNYPLKHKWVLYDHTKSDSETYESSTRQVCEFDNVTKFWQVFNNYPPPSKLFNNGTYRPIMKCNGTGAGGGIGAGGTGAGNIKKEISSLSVFKKGIAPKWEDPVNKYGAEFSKRKFNKKDSLKELDTNWLDMLMMCIGNVIDSSVTGIRVVDSSAQKKNEHTGITEFKLLYRIELWFDNTSKKQIIEDQFKEILMIEDPKAIYYKEHNVE